MLHRIEIALKPQLEDPVGLKTEKHFRQAGYHQVRQIRSLEVYKIESPQITSTEQLLGLAQDLFVDPVLNLAGVDRFLGDKEEFDFYVEVSFRAGVTDNAGRVAKENLELCLPKKMGKDEQVAFARGYFIQGDFSEAQIHQAADQLLLNELIQSKRVIAKKDWDAHKDELKQIPHPHGDQKVEVLELPCTSPAQIMEHSSQRLLALSDAEAKAIYAWFSNPAVQQDRQAQGLSAHPTDVELECIAQTWSEHCKHKIFNAKISYQNGDQTQEINSLYKSTIQACTKEIRASLGEQDWCLSVFKDNAGVIRFDELHSVAFKVETHNSPSALDPYGGALTGIVGVNRDAYGTGMGAEMVCNTDVFCFGPPDYNHPLPKRLFHPTRIFEGVRLGVEHGGNHSGIPTVNGAIVFDDCFVGKPLVFCGTVSIMPAKHGQQKGEDKTALPGDAIVMVGGRIGKDGIHGATFSSLALDEDSPVSAVQIGDPITQKKMFDFLWAAKEQNLYRCVTDNGAGGLSSSVGEMAEFAGGASLHLDKAPLKYDGLQPWEILISEAQERMTLAVPPENLAAFLALSKGYQVESSHLGEYSDSGYLDCFYQGKQVARLNMEFLHKGLPPMELKAIWQAPQEQNPNFLPPADLGQVLADLMARPNICSKEGVIRQYDHEVKGGSVIKPLGGKHNDGPMDAGVLRPVLGSFQGLAVGNGICPKYSKIDTYHMAANAIDEAIRNVVAAGASLEQIAGLDNFCWPDPVQSSHTPDGHYKLAQLVRACQAIYDYCTGFGVPCISGKDSMKNDANLDGKKISILPTLLFSTLGKVKDVRKAVTSDLKEAGDLVYLLGVTKDELGASEYFQHLKLEGGAVPKVDLKSAKERYQKLNQAMDQGLIRSAHDCSDGGLGVALAETAFAGGLGLEVSLDALKAPQGNRADLLLFSESASRLVVSIKPQDQKAFLKIFGEDAQLLGQATLTERLVIRQNQQIVLEQDLPQLKAIWKAPLAKLA